MPMLMIGALALTPRRPDDLDAQLVAATGCNAAEIETLLAAGPDRAARALLPFLGDDAPPVGALAAAIARDPDAIATIRALYAAPTEVSEILP